MASERSRILPQVVEDIEQAIAHYEAISPELADRFRAEASERLTLIEQSPKIFPFITPELRFTRFRTFPYIVVFDTQHAIPVIARVKHAASDT